MVYTLLFKDKNGKLAYTFSFQSIRDFSESWSATVTQQVVEYGFNITDNINIEAPTYSVSGVITNYSLFDESREIYWNGEDFVSDGVENNQYHTIAREWLIELFKSRAVITLLESDVNSFNTDVGQKYSELKSGYSREVPNCVITGMEITQPDKSSNAFAVNLKIQKVDVAVVATVRLTPDEMLPVLQPLVVQSQGVSSSTSASTDTPDATGTTKSSDPANGKAEANKSDGISFEEGAAQARLEKKPVEDEIAAYNKATAETERTGNKYTVVQNGGAYDTVPMRR